MFPHSSCPSLDTHMLNRQTSYIIRSFARRIARSGGYFTFICTYWWFYPLPLTAYPEWAAGLFSSEASWFIRDFFYYRGLTMPVELRDVLYGLEHAFCVRVWIWKSLLSGLLPFVWSSFILVALVSKVLSLGHTAQRSVSLLCLFIS